MNKAFIGLIVAALIGVGVYHYLVSKKFANPTTQTLGSAQALTAITSGASQDADLEITDSVLPKAKRTFVVLVDNGSLMGTNADGTKAFNINAIAKKFYKKHPDTYDFLGIYSDFPSSGGGGTTISNDASGTGRGIWDDSASFGSKGKLKTISALDLVPFPVGLNANGLKSSLYQDFFQLAHEFGHHWCCYVTTNPNIAGQNGHWLLSYGHTHPMEMAKQQLDTDGLDIMGGADFIDNNDGTFTMRDYSGIGARVTNFSNLTRYLMGFVSDKEVPVSTFLTFPVPVEYIGTRSTAAKSFISIQDIVNANGARSPDYTKSQKNFNAALILVVQKSQRPTQESIQRMNNLVDNFPWYWARATHCESTMSTNLLQTNAKPCTPISLANSVAKTSPAEVPADGGTKSTITIKVKDAQGLALSDRVVTIFPDNVDKNLISEQSDRIRPFGFTSGNFFGGNMYGISDSKGKVVFTTTSKVASMFSYFVIIDGQYLPFKPAITFTP